MNTTWGCLETYLYDERIRTAQEIGTGKDNTDKILKDCNESSLARAAVDYRGGGKSDWFVPSRDELNELCKYALTQTTGTTSVICNQNGNLRSGFLGNLYWSSSEVLTVYGYSNLAWIQALYSGVQAKSSKYDAGYYLIPVRAF